MRFAKRAGAIICTIILAVTFCFGTTTAAAATQSEKSMNIRAINNDLPVPFSLNDYQVTQYKGSYNFVEKSGGYYYMYSPVTSKYRSAYAYIVLPTGFNRANHRNAFISLGMKGKHGIDLGITNQGKGWCPYMSDFNASPHHTEIYDDYVAPSTAKGAIITIKPVNSTTVHLYIQFKDANDENVGKVFDKDIKVTSGNISVSNEKLSNGQFYRFVSFITAGKDNQADGSYLTGGMFKNCQLYNGTSYVSWGKEDSTVKDCFSVSKSHVTLSWSGQNDTFNIRFNG